MQTWIFTGISGSGRIELLHEVKNLSEKNGKKIMIYDIGQIIIEESERFKIPITDKKVLDIDKSLLRMLRVNALKIVENKILKNPNVDLHLIGCHATFRWKKRLIEGIAYQDIVHLSIDGFINVVDDLETIQETNSINPKWDKISLPDSVETQEWMMEEEFVTHALSEILNKPMYIVARNHSIDNLFDLFFTSKKHVYLSYPITAIKDEKPELLKKIQGEILKKLEDKFIVFNPLTIKDMNLTYLKDEVPNTIKGLNKKAIELIKARTIERDYRFIDQSDAVVVIYLTDKLSPGVLAEILYANRNGKEVFMAFSQKRSPFIEDATTHITKDLDSLMQKLDEFVIV